MTSMAGSVGSEETVVSTLSSDAVSMLVDSISVTIYKSYVVIASYNQLTKLFVM